MNNNFPPPLEYKATEIPFDKFKDFTWERFEKLCLDIAKAEYKIEEIRPYGTRGDKQEGIDIYAYDKILNKYLTLQCKKVATYNRAKIVDAVNLFLNGDFKNSSYKFILCCSDDLSKGTRQLEIDNQNQVLKTHDIDFIKWDFIGINQILKKHPKIVGETFGVQWVKAFFSEEEYLQYIASYKPKVPKPNKNKYAPIEDYIPRTIQRKQNEPINYFDNQTKKGFINLIEENKENQRKFILLSYGGNGKSIELSYIANYFSEERKNLFPIKILLRDYSESDKISEMLSRELPNWEGIEEENLLLLFDGLDEVSEKEYILFAKKVNHFIKDYPNAAIIISSRTHNFSSLKGDLSIQEFEVLFLNEINNYDIRNYLTSKLGNKLSEFETLIKGAKINELMFSPFYLSILTDIFLESNQTNSFPKSKAEALDRIIEYEHERANKKFSLSFEYIKQNKARLDELLQTVAFSMTLLWKNKLTEKELSTIVTNDDDKRLLRYSFLDYSSTHYQFSHNLIQEYLSAFVLMELDVDKIKDCIAYKPSFLRIKNKWLNTVSFLFSIFEKTDNKFKEIIKWLDLIEPEILINIEADKLSFKDKLKIVKLIINKYKKKKIHLPYTYFTDNDLGKFLGYDNEGLKYWINEAFEIENPIEIKLFSLRIIEKFEDFFNIEEELVGKLQEFVLANIQYPYLQVQAIRCIIALDDKSKILESYSLFREKCENITERHFRNGIYTMIDSLIEKIKFEDEYLDFAIEGVDILNKALDNRTIGIEASIVGILLASSSVVSIKKVIQLFLDDKASIDNIFSEVISFDKSFLTRLIENAAKAFNEDEIIFDYILKLIEYLQFRYNHDKFSLIINPFFTTTKTEEKAFLYFYNKSKSDTNRFEDIERMLLFSNSQLLETVYKDYEDGIITQDYIRLTRNILNLSSNKQLFELFYRYINKRSKNKFRYEKQDMFDWEKHRENQRNKDQELLLNKTLLLKEVEIIFKKTKKKDLSKTDLWDFNKRGVSNEDKMNNTLALPLLRSWADDIQTINYQTIESFYSSQEHWTYYVVNEVVRMLGNNVVIQEPLKEFTTNYVFKTLEGFNLKNSIRDSSNGGFTYTHFSSWLNLFCEKWELELPVNVLLDLLYTDHFSVDQYSNDVYEKRPSNYVLRKISDKSIITQRVLENLESGDLAIPVLGSHFYLCNELKITKAKKYIRKELKSNRFSEYTMPKVLEIYLSLGGSISDLIDTFKNYPRLDYWYFELAEKLINDEYCEEEVCVELIKIINEDSVLDDNKNKAALLLLKKGKTEAIEYFCTYIKHKNQSPFDHTFWYNVKDVIFNYEESLKLLFDALKYVVSYTSLIDSKVSFFDRVDDPIFQLINIIGLQSDLAFNKSVEHFNLLIKENEDTNTNYNLNYPLDNLERVYYSNLEEALTIKEVKLKLKELELV